MKIIVKYKLVSVDWLKVGKPYQRGLEPHRLRDVEAFLIRDGFLPNYPIVTTEDGGIVDGQHRYIIAKKLGMKEVPVSIYQFDSIKEEAEFFARQNSYSNNLKCTDVFNADLYAEDPAAKMIYQLESDPKSLLYQRIGLKDKGVGDHDKFSLGAVVSIINTVAFGLYALHWKKSDHPRFTTELQKKGYDQILSHTNLFLTWFYKFAPTRKENPLAYKLAAFRGVLRVYSALEREGFLSTPAKWSKTVEQMKKFDWADPVFNRAEWTGRSVLIRDHINKGRTHRLEM